MVPAKSTWSFLVSSNQPCQTQEALTALPVSDRFRVSLRPGRSSSGYGSSALTLQDVFKTLQKIGSEMRAAVAGLEREGRLGWGDRGSVYTEPHYM